MLAYHLEINDESILEKVKAFFQTFPSSAVTLIEEKEDFLIDLDKKQPFSAFAGMWEGREVDQQTLRESAWRR